MLEERTVLQSRQNRVLYIQLFETKNGIQLQITNRNDSNIPY